MDLKSPGSQWLFPTELSRKEEFICKRLKRTGRLFAFLRRQRHRLFDAGFQSELAKMYADSPRGTPPLPPAMLAMVTLLQAYEHKSDAAAVEEAVFDARWQMVLACLGAEEPPFSQGVLVDFRRRLIAHNLDRRLLERTVDLARETGEFGAKQLKVALDSAPLWGSGRTEDTFNLIGHALEVLVTCAADILDVEPKVIRDRAELTLLGQSSLKAALDIDWDDPLAQADALQRLMVEVQKLRAWLGDNLKGSLQQPQMKEALDLLEKIIHQDLEPDPSGSGRLRIKRGVAVDRRISIADKDMRHGRKSKSRLFNGFKRHVVRDIERPFILAATVRPANEPEHLAADILRPEVEALGPIVEFHIDRGYLASQWTAQLDMARVPVFAKPWSVRNGNRFPKTAFHIDLQAKLVTCPAGSSALIANDKASFGTLCSSCPLKAQCTESAKGRSVAIHPQEAMLIRLRAEKATSVGRARLRKRTAIEHTLAHVVRRQGPRARYLGIRKNTFDLRRCSAVENLHALDRLAA
jgi:Transposase DDE domain/Transposase domain (DUF772)